LQAHGAEVIVLESHYTSEDLENARADCRGETGKTPNQAEPAPTAKADDSASSTDGTDAALLDLSSTPTEADVYIDEHFSCRTPSTIILMPGSYKIAIKKSGFVVWQKKFKLASGRITVAAELVPKTK
jgi:hypothetical protein